MKLIISRKGLDASFGSFPSPILPDGSMVPIPIPEFDAPKRLPCYGELVSQGISVGDLVESLSSGKIGRDTPAHLDPDLLSGSMGRAPGWMPSFGQHGAALSHLKKYGVGKGDLFLFFGWFRRCEWRGGIHYVEEAPDLHMLFGWLCVGSVLEDIDDCGWEWVGCHPHSGRPDFGRNNSLFVAADSFELPRLKHEVPGAGLFERARPELVLTEPGETRSHWLLPLAFSPRGRVPLTYHGNLDRWEETGDGVRLSTVGRGQEFILDCEDYPEVASWLSESLFGPELARSQRESHPFM